jgi:hypothetical protein
MAYRDNKAANRADLNAGHPHVEASNAPAPASNQAQHQSPSTRQYSSAPGKHNEGNLVSMQESTKGTGVAGRSVSLSYTSKSNGLPAAVNPDGQINRP